MWRPAPRPAFTAPAEAARGLVCGEPQKPQCPQTALVRQPLPSGEEGLKSISLRLAHLALPIPVIFFFFFSLLLLSFFPLLLLAGPVHLKPE